ncbi:hypothetical protein BDY17DRAFT_303683 [Neohortaea acidophila]|uniref:Uncharacterized protein n=1 Tax=Neohortaea acidophila TaxID=245834 RepID=A0A6A6PH55_9PEZI|nr:uncharacterized protein BDY17DRAFT_303683 [Neohortaea acidophila]KAF2479329.1 hypothetical protein BDY17DRAFT_303683 [Neohortaea acidophila]
MYSLIFATMVALSVANPLGDVALFPRQTSTPFCSQAFASCTEISQRRSATFYCASLLGTTIETAVATHYTIVPLTCGGASATDAAAAMAATTSFTKPHGQPTGSHPEPACLQPEQTDISSVCSCLSLPPTVTTTTAGPTSTKTGPFSISAAGGPFTLSTYSYGPTETLGPTIYGGAFGDGSSPMFGGQYRDEFYLTNHGELEDLTAMKKFIYAQPYHDLHLLYLGYYDATLDIHCTIDDTTCHLTCTTHEQSTS